MRNRRASRFRAARCSRTPRSQTSRKLKLESLERRNLLTASPGGSGVHANLVSGGVCACPICTGQGLDQTATAEVTDSGPAASLASLPLLSSSPGSTAKLFLDFDGRFYAQWLTGRDATTPAYDIDGDATSFSATELSRIEQIWAIVAEDFAPFNIDVTTIDPGSLTNQVVAVVAIGGSSFDWYGSSAGGVAFIGGFYNSAPNVGYAFDEQLGNGHVKYTAEAISHEAGHLFGLHHQARWTGTTLTESYHSGDANWAPHMGVGYYSTRTTWHNGTTSSSTTFQDDIAILSNSNNAFGMRSDDFGNTDAAASQLAISGNVVSFAGLIGRHDDQDVWEFTTGGGALSLAMNVAQYGPNLDAILELRDGNGALIATADPTNSLSASLSMTLSSGTYYVIARSDGMYGNMGQYTISGTVDGALTASWGTIAFFLTTRATTGENWFSATASQTGWFTVESYFAHVTGNVDLEVYDSGYQLLGNSDTANNSERIDLSVSSGDQIFIRVIGTNAGVTFRCTNLVAASGSTITLAGTSSDDLFVVLPGSTTHRVAVNGVGYDYDAATYTNISVVDAGGVDTLVVIGTAQDETVIVSQAGASVTAASYWLTASGAEFITINAGDGNDTATFYDRSGNDTFTGTPLQGVLSGAGYSSTANGFDVVNAIFNAGGFDQAFLYGSIGNDRFEATPTSAFFEGPGFRHNASGYDTVVGVGGWGNDIALLYDSSGDETFIGDRDAGSLSGTNLYLRAANFERVEARSSGGFDVAFLWDSSGDDYFGGSRVLAFFNGAGFSNYVESFDRVTAISRSGNDTADLYDSSGDDRLIMSGRSRRLEANDYALQTENFRLVRAYFSLGNDTVTMQQVTTSDTVRGRSNWASLNNADTVTAFGMDRVTAIARSGHRPKSDVTAIDYIFSKTGW